MPITAIPKGVDLRKITPVQKRALDELLAKERGTSALTTAILVGVPSIIAGSAVLAYVFKDEAKTWLAEQQDTFIDLIKQLPVEAGGVVADAFTSAATSLFSLNPITPETVNGSTLTRCTRFAVDATDILAQINEGKIGTTSAAIGILAIAKQMKKEGCSRPSAISQAQWDQA
tara:strand:+ start:279 stop:797 length:519 start_codon:yes stop_codon:yes gene_type:complete